MSECDGPTVGSSSAPVSTSASVASSSDSRSPHLRPAAAATAAAGEASGQEGEDAPASGGGIAHHKGEVMSAGYASAASAASGRSSAEPRTPVYVCRRVALSSSKGRVPLSRSPTVLLPPTPDVPSAVAAAVSLAAAAPAAASRSPAGACSSAPLDSHIVDVLQSISLTQRQHSPHRRKKMEADTEAEEAGEEQREGEGEGEGEGKKAGALDGVADGAAASSSGRQLLRARLPSLTRTKSEEDDARSTGGGVDAQLQHMHKKQKSSAGTAASRPLRAVPSQPLLPHPSLSTPEKSNSRGEKPLLDNAAGKDGVIGGPSSSLSASSSSASLLIRCELCNKQLSSPAQLADHQQGRKHQNMVLMAASGGSFRCELCDKTFTSTLDQQKHLESVGHKSAVAAQQATQQASAMLSPQSSVSASVSVSGAASVASGPSSPYTAAGASPTPHLLHLSHRASHPHSTSSSSSPHHTHHHIPLVAPPSLRSANRAPLLSCHLCRVSFQDAGQQVRHLVGARHLAAQAEVQSRNAMLQQQLQQPPLQIHPIAQPPQSQQQQQQQQHNMSMHQQWQQMQLNLYMQQQMTQQLQQQLHYQHPPAHLHPPPFGGAPQWSPFMPPWGSPPAQAYPYPSSSSIYEDEESEQEQAPVQAPDQNGDTGRASGDVEQRSQVHTSVMDEDSIAAGLLAEKQELAAAAASVAQAAGPVVSPPPEGEANLAQPAVSIEHSPVEEVQVIISSGSGDAAPVTPRAAAAPSTASPARMSPAAAAASAAADDATLNASRKRKFGRYSPVVINPKMPAGGFTNGGASMARPRLHHSSPVHPHQGMPGYSFSSPQRMPWGPGQAPPSAPPSPMYPPSFASPHLHAPLGVPCSCTPPYSHTGSVYPLSPPEGVHSGGASTASGADAPPYPPMHPPAFFPPPAAAAPGCAVHGFGGMHAGNGFSPMHPGFGAAAASPSGPGAGAPFSSSLIHPLCKAPHYIFVPYPVAVPSHLMPTHMQQQQQPPSQSPSPHAYVGGGGSSSLAGMEPAMWAMHMHDSLQQPYAMQQAAGGAPHSQTPPFHMQQGAPSHASSSRSSPAASHSSSGQGRALLPMPTQ